MIGRKRKINHEIAPDEIFQDSRNSPDFDVQQFEGRLERPISSKSVLIAGFFFFAVFAVFFWRVAFLQIAEGARYRAMSENNRLSEIPLFGDRGIIYDRNGVELAWNKETEKTEDFYFRAYKKISGTGHLLGYVGHPRADKSGVYWQKETFGRDGIELTYDEVLKGSTGSKLIETDATGAVLSEGIIKPPKNGRNLSLTVDVRLQEKLYGLIETLARQVGFKSGAAVIMDVENGELIALVSYPEYDPDTLSEGTDKKAINLLVKDPRKPFLNRAVSGLYTPGSILKPIFALAALNEGIITPWKEILSAGSISIPNPYFPDKTSVFKDWKVHGLVDMRKAIAVSSDVYFYTIGGGYQGEPGLGIEKLATYARLFGLGQITGVDLPGEAEGIIPTPEWKKKNFNGEDWFLGNTYHTVIGQYGFQVTPVQMAKAIGAIANGGRLLTPHLVSSPGDFTENEINVPKDFFTIVKEGMRKAVTEGTAQGLYVPFPEVAAKTGTAELGVSKNFVNSWVTGFFPYDNPRYSFAVVMERGPGTNIFGGVYIMRGLFDWMALNTPEYLK
ncbi:MAG: penicillin-binding transpeptidase domain-containing protein [Patescibacteria group bacterium]